MRTNNHKITDYDIVLDRKFGQEGTPQRIQAEEDAQSIYSGQINRIIHALGMRVEVVKPIY